MNAKFISAVGTIVVTLGVLIYFASTSTAKAVVTVGELVELGSARGPVQLGARVVEDTPIDYQSSPERIVKFTVTGVGDDKGRLEVVYRGAMPDTLKGGRDVILQGNFDGSTFIASSLVTQCPSKYEPPVPGSEISGSEKSGYGKPGVEKLGTEKNTLKGNY